MAPPQGRSQRFTEQHKAQLVRLKIGCSRWNSNPAAAPSSASTVQADPDRSIDLSFLLAWRVVLLRITVEIDSNFSHPLPNLLMGQWFMIGRPWIGWGFKHGCWCWNPQLYLSQAAWCGIRIPWWLLHVCVALPIVVINPHKISTTPSILGHGTRPNGLICNQTPPSNCP